MVLPILQANGRVEGKDLFLAFSPEREDPGNRQFQMDRIPKVVGGMSPASLQTAVALYSSVFAKCGVSGRDRG